MFPYRDENETQRTPFVNIVIIVLNALVWLFLEGQGLPPRWRGRCATSD